jgi:hypothetical protein
MARSLCLFTARISVVQPGNATARHADMVEQLEPNPHALPLRVDIELVELHFASRGDQAGGKTSQLPSTLAWSHQICGMRQFLAAGAAGCSAARA